MEDDIPFAEAKELAVDIPVNTRGYTDLYIDDTKAVALAMPNSDNVKRIAKATLLAILQLPDPVIITFLAMFMFIY